MSPHQFSMAPIAVLCFLSAGFVLAALTVIGLYGLIRKSRSLMKIAGAGAGIVLASYGAILIGFSVMSRDVDLEEGTKKYFCETDCHVAYQVAGVWREKAVGGEAEQIVSKEEFVVVEMRTWFDPSTISPKRGNGPLTPNPRETILTDNDGQSYQLSPRTDEVLTGKRLHSTPLSTPLRPGESYTSYLVFEVPARAEGLKLWVGSKDEMGALLWGNELSPMHGKIRFRLNPTSHATRSSL